MVYGKWDSELIGCTHLTVYICLHIHVIIPFISVLLKVLQDYLILLSVNVHIYPTSSFVFWRSLIRTSTMIPAILTEDIHSFSQYLPDKCWDSYLK